jgi:hypothetical protein
VSRFLTDKLRLKVNEAKSAAARPEKYFGPRSVPIAVRASFTRSGSWPAAGEQAEEQLKPIFNSWYR